MNAYELLGVPIGASQEQIKKVYLKLAKRYHPDVCKDSDALDRMKNINLAYEAICDGRGRWWSPPIEQKEPEKPQLPPLEEMINHANTHVVDDTYLISIIVGGRDTYSSMSFDELVDSVGFGVVHQVNGALDGPAHFHKRLVATALRWHLRGLRLEIAIRKAVVDDRFYRSEARKRRYV